MNGQTYQQSVGAPSFTTALPVENGFINASNGDLHLEVPFGSFAQRGGGQNTIGVRYDSGIWSSASGSWQPTNVSDSEGGTFTWGGWREFRSAFDYGSSIYTTVSPRCSQDNNIEYNQYYNFIWTAPDGTTHSFSIQTTQGFSTACGNTTSVPTGDALASDATGYHMYVTNYTSAVVYARDGSKVYPQQEDTNGNYVPGGTPSTDSVGRSAVPTGGRSPTLTYALPNSQGTMSTYTVKTTTINVSTNFGVSGVTEYSGTLTVVSEIDLPDGTKYSFSYDAGTTAGHYGLLTSMTLPTGGQITYSWSVFTDSYGNKYTWITGSTNPDGSWTFTPQVVTSCTSTQVDCEQQLTVVRPSGDNEVFTFALNGGSWDGTEQYYNGSISSSNLLATVNQCFNFVTITNGQCTYSVTSGSSATNVTKSANTVTFPGSSPSTTTTEYSYDSYGNATQILEWNYYMGTLPSAADRSTNISYLNGSSYVNANILDRPSSVTIQNRSGTTVLQTNYSYDQYALTNLTGVVNHDDTNYGSGNNVRGNATQISRWLNTNSSWLTKTNYYNTVGNLVQSTDPNGKTTTFSYADNYYSYTPSSPTSAYLTQATRPATNSVNHIEHTQYYFGSGLVSATCGENFTSTCSYGLSAPQPDYISMSYDSMNRLTSKNAGDGGQTTINYGTSVPITNTTTTTIDSTHNLVVAAILDGLGRTSQTQTSSPQGTIYVNTAYDSNGRVHTVSNPHYSASSPTDGTKSYAYDGLDRVTTITEPSGGTKTQSYTANGAGSIMVQDGDEIQNYKNTFVDAFGRTVQVNLFPGSGTVRTQYTYDALDNLTKVDESGTNWSNDRIRTFVYDSLSRLTSVTNAEANIINYTYDGNGNMLTKVNGRGTTISYAYDALNRLISRSYNDGVTPTANFVYDACPSGGCPSGFTLQYAVGRQAEAYTSSAQTFYTYDVMGRNAAQWQCTPVNCGTSFIAFTYAHNYSGEQTSIAYNGNFTLSQAYDSVGRITQLTNSSSNTYNPATIISVSQFSPMAVPTQLTFGNGLAETRSYNPRKQPTQLRVYSPPSTDVLNQTFTWGDPSFSNYDNGVLWGWNASGSGTPTFSRTYTYDGANRLATMSSPADPSGCTGLSWTDDAWANRTNQTVTGGTCSQSSLTINTSNHITNTGFTYDNDGNMTAGTSPYQYDAEDRLTQFNNGPSYGGANYVYDANGRRIEKVTSSGQMHYFYDEVGHVIAETDQNGNWTKEYIYMGGQHVAEFSGGQTYFIHADHLGSTRAVTNYQGTVTDSLDYLPYGEQIAGGSFTTHKFTGYERDSLSGLDYAFARYYSPSLGGFMSVDPANGETASPQSYNRYAYVQNNPLALTDPTGKLPNFLLGGGCGPTLGFDEFDLLDFGITEDFGDILGQDQGCIQWAAFLASAYIISHLPQTPTPPPPPPLVMVEDVDCQETAAAFRDVAYYLRNSSTQKAPTDADYFVTEHLSGTSASSLTPNGRGTSTSPTADYFPDRLGCYQTCRPGNSSQTFSAQSPTNLVNNIPIMFHEAPVPGNANSLSLSSNGRVTINGTPAPEFCGGGAIPGVTPPPSPFRPSRGRPIIFGRAY